MPQLPAEQAPAQEAPQSPQLQHSKYLINSQISMSIRDSLRVSVLFLDRCSTLDVPLPNPPVLWTQ